MPQSVIERVGYGDDRNQFFERWTPVATPVGCAVFIHGGFWRAKYDLTHANPFCAALAARGVATANLEYRRLGQSGGGWPGTFQDMVAGVRAASEKLGGIPVVIGHSAGGHLALRLACENVPLAAVIALSPVADLRLAYELNLSNGAVLEFLGTTPESSPGCYYEACPSKQTSAVPQVLIHAGDDEDVPIAISRAFVEARRSDPVPPVLIEIPNAKHMELIDPETSAGKKVVDIGLQSMNRGHSITTHV